MAWHWFAEVRRRKVHRTLLGYLAAAWLVAQVGEFLAGAFAWPAWTLRALVGILALGLPVVLAAAWFFRLTWSGLVREVESADIGPGHRSSTLAVLAFKPIVASSRDEALELGMTDTLIARLSGVADVIVRPLSSVRRYASLEQDPLVAGRELRVESVLDGSVQKSEGRLRVTARLLRVADGRQLWSGRFDEDYVDIFAVQDSIADRVSDALALQLSEADRRHIRRRPTSDPAAYDLFLNGRYHWNRRASPDDLRKAGEFYSRAVERDPEFALAYSGLADALMVQAVFGARAPSQVCPAALAAVERALAIDPELAEARATRGHIRLNFLHDWSGSAADYDEAVRLDGRYATARMWRGFRLIFVGRADAGLAELVIARELEPDTLALAVNHARGLYWTRRYDEADAQLNRVLDVEPGNGLARTVQSAVRTQQGRYDEVLASLERGAANAPGSRALRGVALARAGRGDEARAELRRLVELRQEQYVSAYDLAGICAALDHRDDAFDWLERAIEEKSSLVTSLPVDPVLDGLRAETRYLGITRQLGLPAP